MKSKTLLYILSLLPFFALAQNTNVQNGLPKDAQVDVSLTDMKDKPLVHEIMIFKSINYQKEYQGLTDENGKFSLRLPAGDTYSVSVLEGFQDSTSKNLDQNIEIPALGPNQFYDKPFIITFQYQASKNYAVLEGCNFDNGKATLQPGSEESLDELVTYLNRKEDEKIEIGGHTDNVGNATSNMKLSLDRANTVRDYLISKGIDPARITTKGYGSTKPLSSSKKLNNTKEGRAENRRIEITFLNQ